MAPRVSDRVRGHALAIAFATLAAIGLAGCGIGAPEEGAPTPTPVASQDVSGAIELARGVVETALRRLELGRSCRRPCSGRPSRPPDRRPRGVYQAVLAGDPAGGFIAIYEFPDPAAAYDAGRAQAAWLGSGPGAIQNPAGTSHVLRQVGNTLVVYGYRPDGPSGPRAVDVATALESIGQGIAIPR
jgi:hypothetical protein